MIKYIYITGMLLFAGLIGVASHRFHELVQNGMLGSPYIAELKAALMLFIIAALGFSTLCYLEVLRRKRRAARPEAPWRVSKLEEKRPQVDEASRSIYAAPKTLDEWEERVPVVAEVKPKRGARITSKLWMGILRVYCCVLPVIYAYVLVNYLLYWLPGGAGNLILTLLIPLTFILSLLTSFGVLRRKRWGLKFGYAVAVFHLLIFPLGTAIGFVMLMALLAETDAFPASRRRIS